MNRRTAVIIILLSGIAALGLGVYFTFFQGNGYIETTAVIEHIEETFVGTNEDNVPEYQYNVYVRYTVDGTEYSALSDYYENGYTEGKEIRIYYDPSDPGKIRGDSGSFNLYLMIAGLVLIAAAVVMYIKGKQRIS